MIPSKPELYCLAQQIIKCPHRRLRERVAEILVILGYDDIPMTKICLTRLLAVKKSYSHAPLVTPSDCPFLPKGETDDQ